VVTALPAALAVIGGLQWLAALSCLRISARSSTQEHA